MTGDIRFETRGHLGLVTLNRPQAMNALTHDMCLKLEARLQAWAADAAVHAVVIAGEGEKAFCAGGDIRALYDNGKLDGAANLPFYRDEYRLNALIFHYPKPYIALIDGIVMGGGVGVSVHGSHRIAGDRTVFAMPETGIGLFPDVGGSYFLPRCPGRIGMYLALTGARLKAADVIYAGIATAYVPSVKMPELVAALAAAPVAAKADSVIQSFAQDLGQAPLAEYRGVIDKCFAGDSVEAIIAALAADGSDWALKTRDILLAKSPTSLKITHRQIIEGAARNFDDCMGMEYRMVNRIMQGQDFFEGVRALIIDKDNQPKWQPSALKDVTPAEVETYFSHLSKGELKLS
jgi:enoyl-CoA hydratase